MIVNRLRIRGKLNLLNLLPLVAVVLVAVPFVAGQVRNAQSSATTAAAARDARQLGALVWELQRERLVIAGYLADPQADDSAMVLQEQVVTDSAEALRASLGPDVSDELASALVRLGSLSELRQSARHRGAPVDSVARAYHAVIDALIDALRLVPQRTIDAEGTRQLTALDALLRANEESALRGMALVATAVSPRLGPELLADASAQAQSLTERFVQQADVDQAALVVLVQQGEAARRLDELARHLPNARDQGSLLAFAGQAFAAAEAQAGLRRLVQDRVTSEIADAAGGRAESARTTAWTVGVMISLLFALVIVLTVMVSRSIANPLQRLTRAAAIVADVANAELERVTDVERVEEQLPRLTAIDVPSGDEVGELAVAFNRVQATAALLLERQVVTRHNVSLMFANVAQRTQNLVRRQLALVDELEREEQSTRLLARLYRLDHLSTRLRRNAENLLVVAGSHNEARIASPTPLTTILRSALAEIEDYQRVNLETLHTGTVAAQLSADLVLVFAELFENATAFSPPESRVDVHAVFAADGWCRVSIVDHGIGMTARQLAEENRRLVERERLDIAPTSVLGLFVVGRLARRYGLEVQLASTPSRGTTATVAIPPSLYTPGTSGLPPARMARTPVALPQRPAGRPKRQAVPEIPAAPGEFPWFATKTVELPLAQPKGVTQAGVIEAGVTQAAVSQAAVTQTAKAAPAVAPSEVPAAAGGLARRGPLNRRTPGAQLPAAALRPADQASASTMHDPSATRTAMEAFESGFARAADTPTPPLARRTPGATLTSGLRGAPSIPPVRPVTVAPQRDPDAERAAFGGYAEGLAEASKRAELGPADQDQLLPQTRKSEQ